MLRRQSPPRLWLMTDERQGEGLWPALERLPRGGGVVFRHYRTESDARRARFGGVLTVAKRRGLVLLVAGTPLAGGHGGHGRPGHGLRSASAHNLRELMAAERAGADLVFLSPVFETRSHPGRKGLGPERFALLARRTRLPVIALGGMNSKRFGQLRGAYGWAGIDAWS